MQPAQAISAIIAARQVVVAGDERQLPPTNFFTVVSDDEAARRRHPTDETLTEGFESVLDVLAAALPTRNLTWHYRSRDERLIAFANRQMYDGRLTTFPGTSIDSAVVFEPVDGQAEVQRGVDTIETTDGRGRPRRRARPASTRARRPTESLGVIALGIKHAERLEDAITERAARPRPTWPPFFDDAPRRALLRQEPRAGPGRRTRRHHPVDRLRQDAARAGPAPLRPAQHRGRRAAAQRRHHPCPRADDGRLGPARPATSTPAVSRRAEP